MVAYSILLQSAATVLICLFQVTESTDNVSQHTSKAVTSSKLYSIAALLPVPNYSIWKQSTSGLHNSRIGESADIWICKLHDEKSEWITDVGLVGLVIRACTIETEIRSILPSHYAIVKGRELKQRIQYPTIRQSNQANNSVISRAHSFPRAAEFRAEPRNLAVAAEFPCFRGISRNSA